MKWKKGICGILLVLLYTPIGYAEIVLEGLGREKVNLGDEITIRGYIQEPANIVGSLKFILKCRQEHTLQVKTISVTANVKKDIQEKITILPLNEETCTLVGKIESRSINEQAESQPFLITKELNGNFKIDRKTLKLGDELKIKGDLFKLDGTPIEGVAYIRLKQGSNTYFTDTQRVIQGKLDYIFKSQQNPAGSYTLEIEVKDMFNNQQTFIAGTFAIVSNINLFTEVDKLHAPPGKKIKLLGEATMGDKAVEKGTVRLEHFGRQEEIEFEKGTFIATIEIPASARTGTHNIEVFVVDEFGNYGSSTQVVTVDALPKKLEIVLNKENFQPADTVIISPKIKDQTNEIIETDITIKVTTPKRKEALTDIVASNTELKFILENAAIPGVWHVEASALGLKESVAFVIAERVALNYEINDQTLLVTNNGNIKFEGPIEIQLESLERSSTMIKELSIGVQKSVSIDLSKGITSGTYDITIGDKVFENVKITGKETHRYTWLFYSAAIIIVIGILIIYKSRKKGFRGKKASLLKKKGSFDGYVDIRNVETNNKERKPLQFKIKKSPDQYVFKEQKPYKREYPTYGTTSYKPKEQEKKKEGGGLFNMFD